MAAIVITLIVCMFGTWLALVLTKTISVETIYPFLSHLATFLLASFLPGIVSVWREKRLVFDTSSDPPSKGVFDAPP